MSEAEESASRTPEQGAPAAPEAIVENEPRISLVWIAPLVALALAGWLAWRAWDERGIEIVVSFETASGLEADKTQVRYRDVEIGEVEDLALSEDRRRVLATLRMAREAEPMLGAEARFWVVRPRFGAGGVSGLDTLVSGAYIEMDAGEGETTYRFEGLEDPPVLSSDAEGTTVVFVADELRSLAAGSPIYHNGVEVGEILGYRLDEQDDNVVVFGFVRAPHNQRLKPSSRFWNVSGLEFELGADGVEFGAASLQTLLAGGVAFDNPPEARREEPAPDNTVYALYDDIDDYSSAQIVARLPFVAYFDGSVRGLNPGAPVELKGIQLGRVTSVRLEYDRDDGSIRIPVGFEVYPERVAILGEEEIEGSLEDGYARIDALVAQGLRAQIQSGNLITGEKLIALDFHARVEPARLALAESDDRTPPEFPTVATTLDTLSSSAQEILAKIAALPVDQIAEDVRGVIVGMRDLVESPEIAQTLDDASRAMGDVSELANALRSNTTPILARVEGAVAGAESALRQAEATLQSVEGALGENSSLRYEATALMGELSSAARSIRAFAEYLERHPEALLQGKRGY